MGVWAVPPGDGLLHSGLHFIMPNVQCLVDAPDGNCSKSGDAQTSQQRIEVQRCELGPFGVVAAHVPM